MTKEKILNASQDAKLQKNTSPKTHAPVSDTPPLTPDHNTSSDRVMTSALGDVPLKVSVVLGDVSLSVEDLLRLRQGSTLPLHRRVDDLIEIYVHNQRVALGEIVALDNGLIGVAIREVMRSTQGSSA